MQKLCRYLCVNSDMYMFILTLEIAYVLCLICRTTGDDEIDQSMAEYFQAMQTATSAVDYAIVHSH